MEYITLKAPETSSLLLSGYMFDHLLSVYLSSGSVLFPSLTSVNNFTNSRRVSSICPAFSGYLLPSTQFNVVDKNRLTVNIFTALTGSGDIDVIFYNNAGYTKLSDSGVLIHREDINDHIE